MQSDFEKELEQAIYGSRLLVLLETPDGFSQVLFDKDHFKRVSDAVASGFPKHDCGDTECIALELSDDTLPTETFEGMTDYDETPRRHEA